MEDIRTLKAFFDKKTGSPTFPDGGKLNTSNPTWKNCQWVPYTDPRTKDRKGWVEGPSEQIKALESEYLKRSPVWNKNILP